MSANPVLAARDVNAPVTSETQDGKSGVKTMEYHRQVLQSRLSDDSGKQQYVSPSDNIMSPCTAKLSAYRSKHFLKAKPQSLFAKTSSKNMAPTGAQKDEHPEPTTDSSAEDSSAAASQASSVVGGEDRV